MATKQLRIDSIDNIRKELPALLQRNINVVLSDNTVQFGYLQSSDANGIVLRNMRLKDIRIPFSQISEIYSDKIA